MDVADAAILHALQIDSSPPVARLAERLSMSASTCHRRIRALEEKEIIAGYAAQVDPKALGLNLHAFVEITLIGQSRETMDRFEAAVSGFDDVLECHLMSGDADYLLRVAATDVDAFDRVHRTCLSRLPGVASMRSSFSIRQVKPMSPYRVP